MASINQTSIVAPTVKIRVEHRLTISQSREHNIAFQLAIDCQPSCQLHSLLLMLHIYCIVPCFLFLFGVRPQNNYHCTCWCSNLVPCVCGPVHYSLTHAYSVTVVITSDDTVKIVLTSLSCGRGDSILDWLQSVMPWPDMV